MLVQLATVEEAYNHKKETKETIEEMIWLCSLFQLQDTMDAVDDGTDEFSLLLAVNKIYAFFIVCIQNKNLVMYHVWSFFFPN